MEKNSVTSTDKTAVFITVSEDIINDVVKPVSMFLNDIKAGAVMEHIPVDARGTGYALKKVDKKVTYPTFKFKSSLGGTFKFTAYDLRNFSFNGVRFADYFVPQPGKTAGLQASFTIGSVEPVLVDNEKVYPLFCYEGYSAFTTEKEALPENTRPSDEMYTKLKASGVKQASIERYYRIINIDKPIFYYED
jgi:hypothetical protein